MINDFGKWLKGLRKSLGWDNTHRTAIRLNKRTARPGVEMLEDRCVPSVTLIYPSGTELNSDGATVNISPVTATGTSPGDTLTFMQTGLPGGLQFNTSTGAITGVIADNADTAVSGGAYSVQITATDPDTTFATATINWTVTADPVSLTNPGTQPNDDGATVNLSLVSADSLSDTLTFTQSGLPANLQINSSTGAITGTVAANADTTSGGVYTVTVTATDPVANASDTQTFTWNISASTVTFPTNPGTQTNNDGATVNLPLSSHDSSSNPLTFTATGLPSGLQINSTTGAITGIIAANAAASNSVVITATDATANASASEDFTWDVNPGTVNLTSPGAQTSLDGAIISLPVTASTTPTPESLTYSATGLPTGLQINATTGLISGAIADNAFAGGPYSVTITATDGADNSSASQTFTWTVNANFGTITGIVFLDSNHDGVFDTGDVLMPGVAVTLTGTDPGANGNTTIVATAVTNAAGSYTFTSVPGGDYKVQSAAVSGLIYGTAQTFVNGAATIATAAEPGGTSTIKASPGGATESHTTVTITTAAANTFAVGQQVTIAGVGVAGYNGTFTITAVNATKDTFTYTDTTTGLAASGGGTASGDTVKITTTAADGFKVGQSVTISNAGLPGYDGTFTILTTPTPTTFTYNDATTGLANSTGGSAGVLAITTSGQTSTQNFVYPGGVAPSAFSLRLHLTTTTNLSFPFFAAAGSGTAAADATPTVKTPISAITETPGTTPSPTDLAGTFTDANYTDSEVTFNIIDGATSVASATVTNGGSGYNSAPTVTFSAPAGGGTIATGKAVISGTVTSVGSIVGGSGYTSAPTVTFVGGGGTGATGTATFSGGKVTGVTITHAGSGYSSAPTVKFTGGHGTGAGATATITGSVTGITITNGGAGYTSADTLTVTIAAPTSGTTATATAALKTTPINVTLLDPQAPQNVANFFDYINAGDYNNAIFTRLTSPTDALDSGIGVLQAGGLAQDFAAATIAASPNGATESGSTVTITTTTANSFQVGQIVSISNVGVAGYDGIFTITAILSPTSFTYTDTTASLAASGGGSAAVKLANIAANTGDGVPGNEYNGANPNATGTLSMAQGGGNISSATQFFFNTTNDSTSLGPNPTAGTPGFTVFGKAADPASLAALEALTNTPVQNLSGTVAIKAGTAGASESGGTVTITTTEPNNFVTGQSITISGVGVAGYNGAFTSITVTSPTTFTYTDTTTGLANSGGGSAVVPAAFANASGANLLNSVPLTNSFTGNDTNFPTSANPNNFLTIASVTVDKRDEFLTYSLIAGASGTAVGGTNPGIATASITNEYLTITPGSAAGTTTFTVQATDRFGATVTTTVAVTVN